MLGPRNSNRSAFLLAVCKDPVWQLRQFVPFLAAWANPATGAGLWSTAAIGSHVSHGGCTEVGACTSQCLLSIHSEELPLMLREEVVEVLAEAAS